MSELVSRNDFLKRVGAYVLTGSFLNPKNSPSPSVSEETTHNLISNFMDPFVAESRIRRQRHLREMGEKYRHRVDLGLNDDKVNFLFSISGYNFEPPFMKIPVILESHSLLSFNQRSGKFDSVSITHDTRAPEIERYIQRDDDGPVKPIKISDARRIGGFRLARRVFENATGLAVDFQLALTEDAVVTFVDDVVKGLDITVPKTFKTSPIVYKNLLYPDPTKNERKDFPLVFEAGEQRLSGLRTIQFIKAVPEEGESGYDKTLEHNARKFIVFEALSRSLRNKALDIGFWWHLNSFLRESFNNKTDAGIACDFNPAALILDDLPSMIGSILRARLERKKLALSVGTGTSVYIVDQRSGDGGVTWITSDKGNPITESDLAKGVYTDPSQRRLYDMEIPIGGDPYADDLIEGYWKRIRKLVKEKLTA